MKRSIPTVIQLIKNDSDGRHRDFISALFPSLTSDKDWHELRDALLAANEIQLQQYEDKVLEFLEDKVAEIPGFRESILVAGFSKLDSKE